MKVIYYMINKSVMKSRRSSNSPGSNSGRDLRKQALSGFNSSILDGVHINLAYICCVLCFTKETCVEWLKDMEFIATSMKCTTCNNEMITKTVMRLSDGVVWYCPKVGNIKKICGKRISVRLGSWFEHVNMTLEQILVFTYLWINKYNRRRIVSETGITSSLYVQCDKFHLRVCEEILSELPENQNNPSSSRDPLDRWLQKHEGGDTFIDFLKDASHVYQKGAAKSALTDDKK